MRNMGSNYMPSIRNQSRSNGTETLKVKRLKHFPCKCYPEESRGHSTNTRKKK